MVILIRTQSESSEDVDIHPLELEDLLRQNNSSHDEEGAACVSESDKHFFSPAMGIKRKRPLSKSVSESSSLAKLAWKNAALKAIAMGDPWERLHLEDLKVEKVKRHRYNARKQKWVVDEVVVKMESEPFNRGAMRECYRMKKLSNFVRNEDWSRAHNYVAKCYMSLDASRELYFDDVMLQMNAKLWAEEFNRHNPPKKVDIFQLAVLEMTEREGSPLFHVEHFIEGKYVKYNSNSGFVLSELERRTPQAFSHFTFERSGHELMVVDVQGVGDLYTDPQIHTASGQNYGDGNLGTRGMALFFHSHICNDICRSLDLTQFDLAASELNDVKSHFKPKQFSHTVIRGTEEHVILPTPEEREHIQECLRIRSISSGYLSSDERERIDSVGSYDSLDDYEDLQVSESEDSAVSSSQAWRHRRPRVRYDSTSDFDSVTKEEETKSFKEMVARKTRPSHILNVEEHELLLTKLQDSHITEHSILGQVHLDLARYHELNRFVEENEMYDKEAAYFHLKKAADCGNMDALIAVARIHLSLPHDILPSFELTEEARCLKTGFSFLMRAAEGGDRAAMIQIAKAFDSGEGLPDCLEKNWLKAVAWYDSAIEKVCSDREGNYDGTMDDPTYLLVAIEAELYLKGGFSLDRDPDKAGELYTQAAELATEAMKGKLASKYYMMAEEAWAEME